VSIQQNKMTNKHRDLTTEVFGKQKMFGYLVDHLRSERSCISAEGGPFIEEALDYFDNIKEEFEWIVNRSPTEQEENEINFPAPYDTFPIQSYPLREIFEAINGEGEKSLKLISQTIGKLEYTQEGLEQLAESPLDFYKKEEETRELLDMCQKFQNVYNQLS